MKDTRFKPIQEACEVVFHELHNNGVGTNHSLRATGATCLFNAGMPEKVIQKTTGHRSIKALKGYEKVSMDQHQASTRVLTSIDLIIHKSKFVSSSFYLPSRAVQLAASQSIFIILNELNCY